MRLLQRLLGLVQAVLEPVAGEREGLGVELGVGGDTAPVGAHARLVDVVAEVDDEVEVLLGHVVVRCVVAVLPRLAGGERELQVVRLRQCRRGGPGAAHGRYVTPRAETVVVHVVGLEPADLRVHRVGELGSGDHAAALHDMPEGLVGGHFVLDPDGHLRHAAQPVHRERIRRQPRPQHDTVGQRLPGRHAEGERVTAERGRRVRRTGGPQPSAEHQRGGTGTAVTQHLSTRKGQVDHKVSLEGG